MGDESEEKDGERGWLHSRRLHWHPLQDAAVVFASESRSRSAAVSLTLDANSNANLSAEQNVVLKLYF